MNFLTIVKRGTGIGLIVTSCIAGMSFMVKQIGNDFLKELGISQAEADNKINQGVFNGFVNTYALEKAKKIPSSAHAAIIESAVAYTRHYTASSSFKTEYERYRQQAKPNLQPLPPTPDSLRNDLIKKAVQTLESAETALKTATPETKSVLEEMVTAAKTNLDDLKSPDNAYLEMYKANYATLLDNTKASQAQLLAQWNERYPSQAETFIKRRLEQFMNQTKDVDFKATTVLKNGRQKFTNPEYERKNNHWKLAYRMGEPAVRAARKEVAKWIADLGG